MTIHDTIDHLQAAKNCVLRFYSALDEAGPDASATALQHAVIPDGYLWRGMHPFHECHGAAATAEVFWAPLKASLSGLQRRMDVLMAGRNDMDGGQSVWVASMGHLMGLFDAPWLGIPATRRLVMLRYAEFHRVVAGRIAETATFVDIPHLMIQAGIDPFPNATAAHLVQPGPMTHAGVMTGPQDPAEGERTLAAINAMIRDLGQWDLGLPLEVELRRTWQEDMVWWGPAGIGATYTIPRYAEQHAGPFRAGFADRTRTNHIARIAEGHFGGFFGWPNFTARPTGGFMGMPATDKAGPFRVIDIYRRGERKLAENWIFIDLLHFWAEQGVDVLSRSVGNRP